MYCCPVTEGGTLRMSTATISQGLVVMTGYRAAGCLETLTVVVVDISLAMPTQYAESDRIE